MSAQCQVERPDLKKYLMCSYKESGGMQCERQDIHGNTGHYISEHTTQHALSGNGYACDSFEYKPPIGPRRREILAQIEALTKELQDLTR